jgi:hypothetical protein
VLAAAKRGGEKVWNKKVKLVKKKIRKTTEARKIAKLLYQKCVRV